jgi:fatty-acid peroxygenase
MATFPHDGQIDSTLALLRDGYAFVSKRCAQLGTDAFETRLMLKSAICALGEDAARMFYEPGRFTRQGAMPLTTLMLLQDEGSVQLLSGVAHAHRKRMFLRMMEPEPVERLVQAVCEEWLGRVPRWSRAGRIVLLDEVSAVLCRAALRWAGLSVHADEAEKRTRELAAMVDGAGAVGPRNWRALAHRYRAEQWARGVVRDVRAGRRKARDESVLHTVATQLGEDGEPLPVPVAAVELLNVLRPIVAVARFVVFAADGLRARPQWADHVAESDEHLTAFVQEVRRYYPFFPVIGGRVQQAFEWRGHSFDAGTWVLLDLYGTNHDERTWDQPHLFAPERFLSRSPGAFDLVPQGAGEVETTHRCPGEPATIDLMKAAVLLLATSMDYDVPPQDGERVRDERSEAARGEAGRGGVGGAGRSPAALTGALRPEQRHAGLVASVQ